MTGQSPILLCIQRCYPTPAVAWMLARPQQMPLHIQGWSQQRFWRWIEMQVGAKVYEHEPVVAIVAKKSQDKCLLPKDRTVYPAGALPAKHRILAPQPQQVTV